jgi:hypothetical protein
MAQGGTHMATSSFYETVFVDDKAADILIKGLNSPKFPPPKKRSKEEIERCEQLLQQFHSSFETSDTRSNE